MRATSWALAALAATALGFGFRNGTGLSAPVLYICALAAGYAAFGRRLGRFGAALALSGAFFAMGPLTRAVSPWDGGTTLRAMDAAIGADLVPYVRHFPSWFLELMTACYLWFHVYLIATFLQIMFRERSLAAPFLRGFWLIYGIGFVCYLLLPGSGPKYLWPEAYAAGGPLLHFSDLLAEWADAERGVFPSLHAAGALYILVFDARFRPRRAARWALPVVGVILSTVLLGYHYTVDVLAGMLLVAAGWIVAVGEPAVRARPARFNPTNCPTNYGPVDASTSTSMSTSRTGQ